MDEIKMGSEQWFEKLKQMVIFPKKFIFYFDKKSNYVGSRVVNSKAKIDNIRWTDIKPSALYFQSEENTAIICIKEIQTLLEYYEVIKTLTDEWAKQESEESE